MRSASTAQFKYGASLRQSKWDLQMCASEKYFFSRTIFLVKLIYYGGKHGPPVESLRNIWLLHDPRYLCSWNRPRTLLLPGELFLRRKLTCLSKSCCWRYVSFLPIVAMQRRGGWWAISNCSLTKMGVEDGSAEAWSLIIFVKLLLFWYFCWLRWTSKMKQVLRKSYVADVFGCNRC